MLPVSDEASKPSSGSRLRGTGLPSLRPEPGRVIGRGHTAGDLLEAYDWVILEEGRGHLRVRAHVPDTVRNPRGQLFGGFTPTYVDLISLFTFRTAQDAPRGWLATLNLRLDYFEPITGSFEMDCRVVNQRGHNAWIETRFLDPDGTMLAFALLTLRETEAALPQG